MGSECIKQKHSARLTCKLNLFVFNENFNVKKIHLTSSLNGLHSCKVCHQYIYRSVTETKVLSIKICIKLHPTFSYYAVSLISLRSQKLFIYFKKCPIKTYKLCCKKLVNWMLTSTFSLHSSAESVKKIPISVPGSYQSETEMLPLWLLGLYKLKND